jgi:PhzF family phenazine biosynthesis protein
VPRGFSQVDVFGPDPATAGAFRGNPVAVVHAAEGLSADEMARFANLSETTYLLPPTRADADYRLRIFTPTAEIDFAGHPTLGSAHAWLAAGGVPSRNDVVVQECAAGLVRVRLPREPGDRFAFAAPPLVRSGPLEDATFAQVLGALRVSTDEVIGAAWVDNGAGFLGVHLSDAATVLALTPDFTAFGGLEIGVIGTYSPTDRERHGIDVEVRSFVPSFNIPEDPVTGSLNAGLAQWLIGAGALPSSYVASQGTCLGRAGRVYVDEVDEDIWVGGATRTMIEGSVDL